MARPPRNPYATPSIMPDKMGIPNPSPKPSNMPFNYVEAQSRDYTPAPVDFSSHLHNQYVQNTPNSPQFNASMGSFQAAETARNSLLNRNTGISGYGGMGQPVGYQSPQNAAIVNPLIAAHQAQQARNGMTAYQKALVDAAPGFAAANAPVGPREGFIGRPHRAYVEETHRLSPGSAAATNNVSVGGADAPGTVGVYGRAAQRQAQQAAAYKALLARRFAGRAGVSPKLAAANAVPQPGAQGPGPITLTNTPNGVVQTAGLPGRAAPFVAPPLAPGARMIPNVNFAGPNGVHGMPATPKFTTPPTPFQSFGNSIGSGIYNHPLQWPWQAGLNQMYGLQPNWNPTLGSGIPPQQVAQPVPPPQSVVPSGMFRGTGRLTPGRIIP